MSRIVWTEAKGLHYLNSSELHEEGSHYAKKANRTEDTDKRKRYARKAKKAYREARRIKGEGG